jgi:DNA-binding IclR family transcriptional regulator
LSSLASSLSVLGLFTEQHPTWSADAINEALGFSRPTGYRYVRELVHSGLVARIAPGTYALGPRIIELDFQIRLSDPLLKAGLPVIQELVESTGCEVNLIGLYGDHIVTTHQQPGIERLPLSFGRGRPLPAFRGAGSKIIVAHFGKNKLKKLYEAHATQAQQAGLGHDWDSVRAALAQLKKQGHAVSQGELDPGFVGVAAPVFAPDGEILGSVIAALTRHRLGITDLDRLIAKIEGGGQQISQRVAHWAKTQAPPTSLPQRAKAA